MDGQIIFINDEQPHRGKKLSLPGGRVDAEDGSTVDAAQRELHEETGYSFANWRLLHVIQPASKSEWFFYLYLAWGQTGKDDPHLDAGEKITLVPINYEDALRMALNKDGSLEGAAAILERSATIDDLLAAPTFAGKEVDR